MTFSLFRKTRHLVEDPVLRQWLLRKIMGLEKATAPLEASGDGDVFSVVSCGIVLWTTDTHSSHQTHFGRKLVATQLVAIHVAIHLGYGAMMQPDAAAATMLSGTDYFWIFIKLFYNKSGILI